MAAIQTRNSGTSCNSNHSGPPPTGIPAGELAQRLWSHKWFILLCLVISVASCGTYLRFRQPLYKAVATLRIDPSRANSLGLADPQGGMPPDENVVIQTEVGVLRSNRVALRAIDSLSPIEKEHFMAGIRPAPSSKANAAQELPDEQARIVAAFETRLTVAPVDNSELVNVSFAHKDPRIAARIAKGVVAAYESQSLDSRNESVTQLRSWLTTQIGSLKSQVDDSQQRLSDFQEANHILSTQGASNTTIDRLRFLNDRLAQAEADKIVKEGDLRAARSASPATLAALFPNAQLTALQTQRAELYARYAQLSAKFDAKYPPLVQAQNELSTIDSEISNSGQAIVNRLDQEYNAASYVEGNLQRQYDQQTTAAYALDRNQAEEAILQGQVSSSRELLNALENKLQQAVVDAEVTGADVVEVDDPEVPTMPAGPGVAVLLTGAALIGLFAGIAAVVVLESTSDRLRYPEEIHRTIGCPVLGFIPRRLESFETKLGTSFGKLTSETDPSVAREANCYREVRNRLLTSDLQCGHKLIVVASLTEHAGASVAALNTAVALAKAGFRTLVVDADPRNPIMDTPADALTRCEAAGGDLQPLLLPSTVASVEHMSNISFVLASVDSYNSADYLASVSFSARLKRWSAEFDYLILSAPPLMISNESLLLAKLSDGLLLVATYNKTRLKSLNKARSVLEGVGVCIAGALINDVPIKSGSLFYGNEYV